MDTYTAGNIAGSNPTLDMASSFIPKISDEKEDALHDVFGSPFAATSQDCSSLTSQDCASMTLQDCSSRTSQDRPAAQVFENNVEEKGGNVCYSLAPEKRLDHLIMVQDGHARAGRQRLHRSKW